MSSISDLGLFRAIKRDMSWLTERQKLLAANVANADTPDYRALDLKPADPTAEAVAAPLQLARTAAGHRSAPGADPAEPKALRSSPWEVAPDGNAVILEQQMLKLAETQADYQLATELYRKHMTMLKMAIGGHGG